MFTVSLSGLRNSYDFRSDSWVGQKYKRWVLCAFHNFWLNLHKFQDFSKPHKDPHLQFVHTFPHYQRPEISFLKFLCITRSESSDERKYTWIRRLVSSHLLTVDHKVFFVISPMHGNNIPRTNGVSHKSIGCLPNEFRSRGIMHYIWYNCSVIIRA